MWYSFETSGDSTTQTYCRSVTSNTSINIYPVPKVKNSKEFFVYNNSLEHLQAMADAIYFLLFIHERKLIEFNKLLIRWYWKNLKCSPVRIPTKNYYKNY
jgi:hypothetical protein